MKRYLFERIYSRCLLLLVLLAGSLSAIGQTITVDDEGIERDGQGRRVYHLHSIVRGYEDRIVLRWALNDYAPWMLMRDHGYCILRTGYTPEGVVIDTIAPCLLPYTQQQIAAHYQPTDTLAMAAASMLYAEGTALSQTQAPQGSMAAIMEVYEEQQMRFALAMLLIEQRFDLAQALGLAIVDRTAQAGIVYQYVIQPRVPQDANFSLAPIISPEVRLGEWEPKQYQAQVTDSLALPATVLLTWPKDKYQQFYVERRTVSDDNQFGPWQTLHERVFVPFGNPDQPDAPRAYSDTDVAPGLYEYRLRTIDSFGQELLPSEPHRVQMRDLVPPSAPVIRYFELLRGDSVMQAVIHIQKDTIEDDLLGYIPYYSNDRILQGMFMPLQDGLTPAQDTTLTVLVTGLPSGNIYVAAIDTAGNSTLSMSQHLFVADLTPPSKPEGIQGSIDREGVLRLSWEPCPDNDVSYYQIYWANDTTHLFMPIPDFAELATEYTDTVSLGVQQVFTYYCVVATDWEGNQGEMSDTIAVERPNLTPPGVCHLERMWDDDSDDHISMRWFTPNEIDVDLYLIFRRMDIRKEGEEVPVSDWTLAGQVSACDLQEEGILAFTDSVPRNTQVRYVYAVEAINRTGISSGLSREHAYRHRGSDILPVRYDLSGRYRQDDRAAVLAWSVSGLDVEYLSLEPYICIYRRLGDDQFRFLTSVTVSDTHFSDYSLEPGQEADYQIRLRLKDRRFSPLSNTIHIVNTIPVYDQE